MASYDAGPPALPPHARATRSSASYAAEASLFVDESVEMPKSNITSIPLSLPNSYY